MSNLAGIRSRLEALMRHAGGTDYAGQVIADSVALLAEVEQLRASATATLNNAWENGAREERQNVVAWLRAESYLTLYEASPWQVSDAIERGDGFAISRPTNPECTTGNFVEVIGVIGCAQFEHDVVRHINNIVD